LARYWGKAVTARITDLIEIAHLRDEYRAEMNCQVIHDSIHIRPDGLMKYALELEGALVGYGSVAIFGPVA
jgi:hypothetical protein